jgi:4'-phosphopantetheinyl transferase
MAYPSAIAEGRVNPPANLAESLRSSIHAWRACMPVLAPLEPELFEILSAEETARSKQFVFARDRRRFVVARGVLRVLLARYTNTNPADLSICRTANGKPFAAGDAMPQFSVSHSDQIALIAFAHGQIGVDVERVREMPDLIGIARRFFSAGELEQVHALPEESRRQAFFALWTRKEAYLKATGEGIAALDSLSVSFTSDLRLRTFDSSSRDGRPRRIEALRMRGGYVAALAAESTQELLPVFEVTSHEIS